MDNSGKQSGKKPGKPAYESPVLVPLGEMDRGFGAACKVGSSPQGSGGLACGNGGRNSNVCTNGGNGPPPSLFRL